MKHAACGLWLLALFVLAVGTSRPHVFDPSKGEVVPLEAGEVRQGIFKEATFGCVARETEEELLALQPQGKGDELDRELAKALSSGRCVLFLPGEAVLVAALEDDQDWVQVRRRGEQTRYWLRGSALVAR